VATGGQTRGSETGGKRRRSMTFMLSVQLVLFSNNYYQ